MLFGLHPNAEIDFRTTQSAKLFAALEELYLYHTPSAQQAERPNPFSMLVEKLRTPRSVPLHALPRLSTSRLGPRSGGMAPLMGVSAALSCRSPPCSSAGGSVPVIAVSCTYHVASSAEASKKGGCRIAAGKTISFLVGE